jgi:hypothetical protein
MMRRTAWLVVGLVLLLRSSVAAQGERKPSPDRTRYAVIGSSRVPGKGETRGQVLIYTNAGVLVAVASQWLVEPDGTGRVGVRGCERWGWVDDRRVFCEGTINPSTAIHRVFDATSGVELGEFGGAHFVWSPDGSRLAHYGNVPHFSDWATKSDSLEFGNDVVYPDETDLELHRFRSDLVWSPDSRFVAVVDHVQRANRLLLVTASASGAIKATPLPWAVTRVDYPAPEDMTLRWSAGRVVVSHGGRHHTVDVEAAH